MPAPKYFDYVDEGAPSSWGQGIRMHANGKYLGTIKGWKTEPPKIKFVDTAPFTETTSEEALFHMSEILASLRGERPCPLQQKEEQMESKTFYEKELDPLRVRALIVAERHKHAVSKYCHDRSTHDGSIVVDRPLFLKLLTSLASAAGLTHVDGWNLATLYSETRHATEQDNAEPVRVDNEEPKMRVPSRCVVDLIGAYHDRFIVGRPRVIKAPPKTTKALYKRTTTKASELKSEKRPVWNSDSEFRDMGCIGNMGGAELRKGLALLKSDAIRQWEEDDGMDWDSDVSWEDFVHPAYEALLIQANNIKLPHLVREYQLTNQNHVNPLVGSS